MPDKEEEGLKELTLDEWKAKQVRNCFIIHRVGLKGDFSGDSIREEMTGMGFYGDFSGGLFR